ncbi:hypothetical protein V1506DRAFT_549811 [Lipomyces tetrasporus]
MQRTGMTMRAVRIHQNDAARFQSDNPAPPSALVLDSNIPVPQIARNHEVLVRIHAATVTRDELTWPETYKSECPIPGHDFSGTVVEVYSLDDTPDTDVTRRFSPEDEVYGMTETAGPGSTWAEYALVRSHEIALKPKRLDWAQSATVPMSALTAWQALFVKAGIPSPDLKQSSSKVAQEGQPNGRRILITGASGAVGTFLVQLAALAGLHVVGCSTSNARNGEFLRSLGAIEVFEYNELEGMHGDYDIIIDTVGGTILEQCWSLVKDDGVLITIDSSSYDFVETHRQCSFTTGKDRVTAIFFIVEPSRPQLEQLAMALDLNLLKVFVAQTLPFEEAGKAYELANERAARRGKIVLTVV